MEFFQNLFQYKFLQYAVIACVLSSLIFGVTGTFVVTKRISGISGGIAHAVLGGVGIAYYIGFSPLIGALVFAIFSAVILGVVKIKAGEHENSVIAALWSIGMAVGILFMFLTPGYNANLMTYLFGNVLIVSRQEIYLLIVMNGVIISIVFLFYRQFIAISFDEEYSSLRGIRVSLVYILLLCLIAVSIVVLMRLVGLILVIALLTLPPTIAMMFTKRFLFVIPLSVFLGIVFTITGLFVSYAPNLPAGAMIVVITGGSYLLTVILKSVPFIISTVRNNKKNR